MTTTTIRANRRARGTTRADIDRVVTELVNDAIDDPRSPATVSSWTTSRPTRSGCWRWSPAKTSKPGESDGIVADRPETRPDRIVSTVDPESRHVHKTTHNYRDGFKAHIAVEPDTGLITACELTAGNVGDAQAAPGLLADETAPARGARRLRLRLRRVPRPPRKTRQHHADRSSRSRCAASDRPAGSPSTTSSRSSTR